MIIYKVTNIVNGKIYIGQTTRSLKERWWEHCRQKFQGKRQNSIIGHAIKKHGKENFEIKILSRCESGKRKQCRGFMFRYEAVDGR